MLQVVPAGIQHGAGSLLDAPSRYMPPNHLARASMNAQCRLLFQTYQQAVIVVVGEGP